MNIISTYHPARLSLASLHEQFPAAVGLYLFCNDGGLKAFHSDGKQKGELFLKDVLTASIKPQVQKFRKLKKEISWVDLEDLPLNKVTAGRKMQIQQLSIQDEIEQNVLVFRVPSRNDDAHDVFAISFSKTFSNFYIASGRNVLSSEMKIAIGKTIKNQITWLYQLHDHQLSNISNMQLAYQQSADELEDVQRQLEKEQQTNRDLLGRYLTQLIKEAELRLNCQFVLKNGFLDKIITTGVAIEGIQPVVERAVQTAHDLSLDKKVIYLTTNLIQLKEVHAAAPAKSSQLVELDKTQAILDRYEQAARKIEQKNLRINGRNLAAELNISGPAITDAIKKHHSKIKRLLEKYPDNWLLISNFIRPIKEIKWDLEARG